MRDPEVEKLFQIRKKYNLSRDLISRLTKIPSANLYRYEIRGLKPSRLYCLEIEKFNNAVARLEASAREAKNE